MAEHYFLYTVTGLREPFYAAVDHETNRVWTAPTKDNAIRQARDAGIGEFVEKTITREKFLRSLGIESEPPRRIQPDPPSHQPQPEPQKPAGSNAWFVVDENAVDDDSNGKTTSIPPRLKTFKHARVARGGSPFAAGPIGASEGQSEMESDDMIIIPSDHNSPSAPTPFVDAPAPLDDDDTYVG